jgi:hypothetical protein
MLLPASLHGQYRLCKAAAAKAVTRIVRGAGLREAFEHQGWVETSHRAGLLVLHGPSPLLGGDPHYQLFLPLTEVLRAVTAGKLAKEDMESIFQQALSAGWGLLSLMAISNSLWTYPEHRHAPFLRALGHHWEEFVREGARYTAGSNTGEPLWTHADTIKGILARRGIPAGEQCPDAAGWADLARRIG